MEDKKYTVYKHTTPNGKVYIGITSIQPLKRWDNGRGYKGQFFGRAINKYGWENIQHDILFTDLTKEQAEQKEIELILLYKSNQREYGYNIDNGGNVKGKISEETRKKMSDLKRGKKPWNYKKIGLLKATNETKVKMSIAHKGKKPWNKGKSNPHSDEMKKNMSKSMKGKIPSAITQKKARESNIVHIKKYSLDGVFICEYESIIDASKEIGLNRSSSHISECCQGKKKTAYGFMWSYSEVK